MNIALKSSLVTILAITLWLICSPIVPVDSDSTEPTLLMLSLEASGRKTAEFSGAPIEAILELDKDTLLSYVHWHTGQGNPYFSDTLLINKAKRFTVQLSWKKYPLVKDSAAGMYYDTVYVSMGGGLKQSNKVVVKVTNLPVVADSGSFNGKRFAGSDTLWKYAYEDTSTQAKKFIFRFFAHDLDGKAIEIQPLVRKGKITRTGTSPSDMEYEAPSGDFVDTVTIIAYDQNGGQVIRRLVIAHSSPNIPPKIDSIQVKTTMLKGAGSVRAGFMELDTLKFRVFAHDSMGTVKKVLWMSGRNTIRSDSADQFRATWVCSGSSCSDSVKGESSTFIDTVTIKAIDDRGDTAVKKVLLYKGKIDQPPVLRAIVFGGKSLQFTDTVAVTTAVGGVLYDLSADAFDPENKRLTYTWRGSASGRVTGVQDSAALYTAPAVPDTDTISVTISDSSGAIVRYVAVRITDIGPIIDSIAIHDTMIRKPPSITTYEAAAAETVLVIVYCFDRDRQTDTLHYSWSARKPERFVKIQSNVAKYILPAKDLNDTIVCTVQDGAVQTVRKISIVAVNGVPVVDSIRRSDANLKKYSLNEYIDRASASDTLVWKVFASDPEGGKLSYRWSASDSSRLASTTTNAVTYVCDSVYYKDTITVSVTDSLSATTQRRLILQVDTTTTP